MKVVGIIAGISAGLVIAGLLSLSKFSNDTPTSESVPDIQLADGFQLKFSGQPSHHDSGANDTFDLELAFREKSGRELWELMLETRARVQAREKLVAKLKRFLKAKARNDPDYREQLNHLKTSQKWQANLEARYRKAVIYYAQLQLEPTPEAQECLDDQILLATDFARKILGGKNPGKRVDTAIEREFKAGAGRELWELMSEIKGMSMEAEEKLGNLKRLLEGKGLGPDEDPDFSQHQIQLSRLKYWRMKLERYYKAALLAFQKRRLNLSDDVSAQMARSLAEGVDYARKVLDGKEPDFEPPAPIKVKNVDQHSQKIIHIWKKLEWIQNHEVYPDSKGIERIFGRADDRGIQRVDITAAKQLNWVHFTGRGVQNLVWWRYIDGNDRKRWVLLWFREGDQQLVGWNWNELKNEKGINLGPPR